SSPTRGRSEEALMASPRRRATRRPADARIIAGGGRPTMGNGATKKAHRRAAGGLNGVAETRAGCPRSGSAAGGRLQASARYAAPGKLLRGHGRAERRRRQFDLAGLAGADGDRLRGGVGLAVADDLGGQRVVVVLAD